MKKPNKEQNRLLHKKRSRKNLKRKRKAQARRRQAAQVATKKTT